MIAAKYVHPNLIADGWRALSDFYRQPFGCVPVPPERDCRGEPLEAGTGIPGARLRGVHPRLPGYGEGGPTLGIFSNDTRPERGMTAVDRPGLGPIAFSVADVADVADARKAVFQRGGRAIGEIVTLEVATDAKVAWRYVTDPEGNIIELPTWTA